MITTSMCLFHRGKSMHFEGHILMLSIPPFDAYFYMLNKYIKNEILCHLGDKLCHIPLGGKIWNSKQNSAQSTKNHDSSK
jgi:hypothetical protein